MMKAVCYSEMPVPTYDYNQQSSPFWS